MNKEENPEIDKYGNKFWRNEKGELHREDGPAIEYSNGDKRWYVNGECHREDGPAVELANGNKIWYKHGKYHRENGPAIEYINGYKYWYKDGKKHRLNGPAIEYINGYKEWWVNGEKHRIDGPAVEFANGNKYLYIEGKQYTEEEFNNKISEMNNVINKKENPVINDYGDKVWRNEKGEYHRIDGPAIEYSNGDKSWYINGKIHREDGPAFESINGDKSWYINGKLHRIDGPAVEDDDDGYKEWYIEGKQYTEEEYYKLIGNKSFTKEISTKDLIKDRLEKVSYRSAGRQLTKGISKVFVKIAENKGMDNSSIEIISKFFQTELGESLIGMILGVGLPNIPKLNKDKRIMKLAEEFQIESISKAADVVLEEALQYFLPIVGDVLKALPEDNKRIESEIDEEIENSIKTNAMV